MIVPYPMNVTNLRRRSQAVYMACEEPVAKDISESLRWAADRIEELEAALREARQYVCDAGGDEDSETQRHAASLLIVINAALAPEQNK